MKSVATTMTASCSPLLPSLSFRHNRRVWLLGLNQGIIFRVRNGCLSFRMSIPSPQALRSDLEATQVALATVPASVPVRVAHELLQAGYSYLDVRDVKEHGVRAGSLGAVWKGPRDHCWMPKWEEIINGSKDLLAEGDTAVTDIAGGYAAWTQNGLPAET